MARSPRYEIGVGLLVLAAALLLAFMAVRVGALSGLGNQVEVEAIFQDVAGLKEGAAVTVAGVDVGRVTHLTVDFDKARVGLALDTDAQIRSDVIVALRARSMLGEKYIELLPQDPNAPLLEDGDVLTNTRGQLEIDQFVTRLGPLLDGLDPETVDQILDPLIAALQEDPGRPARMLDDAEVALHNLRVASEDAPALMADARGTMSEVRSLSRDGRQTLDRANRVLDDVEQATANLPATTERLPGLVDETEATISDARALVDTLNGKTDQVATILDNLEELDKWELRRILREDGIKVRFKESKVVETEE